MAAHAKFSPSGAHRWMKCPVSPSLEEGLPDTTSDYADEGTAAHFLGEQCLNSGENAIAFLGQKIIVVEKRNGDDAVGFASGDTGLRGTIRNVFTVDEDMAGHVQKYLDAVRDFGKEGTILVECRMPLVDVTGEVDAYGTSDAVVILENELQVHDLKYGQGKVVEAEENEQLMIYALAALSEYGFMGDFKNIRLVIHQPRLHSLKEWDCSVEDLYRFQEKVRDAVKAAENQGYGVAVPGEKQCTWCKVKSTCLALEEFVKEAIGADFENLDAAPATDFDLETLGKKRAAVPLIEMWCEAVCTKTAAHLHNGEAVPGWKLVKGKKGRRVWVNAEEAEAVLKGMRLKQDEMYSFSLASPTTMEKVLKDNPRKWKKVEELITQQEGAPSVAPESDKRPALEVKSSKEEFENLEEYNDLV